MIAAAAIAAADLADVLATLRARRPLVHVITNPVAMNLTANALLAVGASPTMAWAPEEVGEVTARAQALVVNMGTPTVATFAAMRTAATLAASARIPWALDPVGVGLTAFRRLEAAALLALRPTAIRANASEARALAGEATSPMRGVDAGETTEAAAAAGLGLARRLGTVVAVTGAIDRIADAARACTLANGDPIMARVTGVGCTASALVGAALAVEPDPFRATVAALAWIGIAGELAARGSDGPGSFQPRFLDALHRLDGEAIAAHARIA